MGKKAGIGEFSTWIHPKSQNPGAAPWTGADFFTPSLFFFMEKNDFSQDSRLENSQFFIKNPEFRAFYAEEIVECRAGREFFPGYSQGSSHFPLLHIFLRKSCFLPLTKIPDFSLQTPPGMALSRESGAGWISRALSNSHLDFPRFPEEIRGRSRWIFPFSRGFSRFPLE